MLNSVLASIIPVEYGPQAMLSRLVIYEPRGILSWLIIGLLAGWLAGKITKGKGFGLLGNLVVGVIGAMIGGFIFRFVGLSAYGTCGSLIMATVGALILLYAVRIIQGKR